MDYSKSPMKIKADPADLVWQVDSEWVNLSPSNMTSSLKLKTKREGRSKAAKSHPRFHFISTSKGGRFLIVDKQALRFSEKTAQGFSLWVCTLPTCNAQCILDPNEKKIIRYCRDHNHEVGVSRLVYKNFINALKTAVKENPHVKPEMLFQNELKRIKEELEDSSKLGENMNLDLSLPSFDDVQTAMCNTRNAILSAFSLRPAEEERRSEEKSSSVGPSGSTRSRDSSGDGKRKSFPSKGSAQNSPDFNEMEEVWSTQHHKDASLSDFEDWLDEDISSNVSHSSDMDTTFQSDDFLHETDGDIWNATIPLEKIPRRKYRKRPASLSVFTCSHCPYKSNRHFNVQRHERLAHSSKKPEFNCKECGTSYSLEYRLKLHIKAVHQGEGHHCHICSRTFETMTGLKSHLVTKHKNDDPKVQRELPPELTCKLCCRVFTTKAHLMKHTSTHVMVQPYRCYSCNQPFLDECTWLTHQNNCNEAFTIQCCLCSRVIPNAQELLTHMDDVHGRAEYSCNCGKAFPWKKSLLTHQQKCSLYMAEKAPIS